MTQGEKDIRRFVKARRNKSGTSPDGIPPRQAGWLNRRMTQWVGVVLGGQDAALAGLTVAGRPLVEIAGDVLAEVGAPRVGSLATAAGTPGGVIVLDAHCPGVIAADVEAVRHAAAHGPAVGIRPVTDTVKQVLSDERGAFLGETVDRDTVAAVTAPLVVPDAAALSGMTGAADVAVVVAELRRRGTVALVEVGALSRRVADASDLELLGALWAG